MNISWMGLFGMLTLTCLTAFAQNNIIPLWSAPAPGTERVQNKEQKTDGNITGVYQPDLTAFLSEKNKKNCPAIVIFPGGGYQQIVIEKEGYRIARWLNENGIAAFVLKYRLNTKAALVDAQRAVSLVRNNAAKFQIDPKRIGVLGFSVGANLAMNLATHTRKASVKDRIDSTNCKPNFLILAYGKYREFINMVNKDIPPTFLVHAADDEKVPVSNSVAMFSALHNVKVPAELHLYEKGGHGFALSEDRGPVFSWAQRCIEWLKERSVLSSQ